jgi:hypothetical protein
MTAFTEVNENAAAVCGFYGDDDFDVRDSALGGSDSSESECKADAADA